MFWPSRHEGSHVDSHDRTTRTCDVGRWGASVFDMGLHGPGDGSRVPGVGDSRRVQRDRSWIAVDLFCRVQDQISFDHFGLARQRCGKSQEEAGVRVFAKRDDARHSRAWSIAAAQIGHFGGQRDQANDTRPGNDGCCRRTHRDGTTSDARVARTQVVSRHAHAKPKRACSGEPGARNTKDEEQQRARSQARRG